MAERHGLRALQVRVPGHHRLRLRLGEGEDDERERVDRLARLRAGVEHVQPERRGDLVVARAAGVDLAADLAEQPLDRGVDVLVGLDVAGRVLRDLREARLGLVELLVRQQAGRSEPPRVLGGRLAVVRAAARRRRRAGSATRRGRGRPRPCPPRSSRGRLCPARGARSRGVQLGLERRDPDEALGGVVREGLAGAVRGELGRRRSCAATAAR